MRYDQDYYAVLGISEDAETREILTAYRKIAFRYHPDKNKEEGAEERFREATEAYDVLCDGVKRREYDKARKPQRKISGKRGADLKIMITVPVRDLVSCRTKTVVVSRKGRCNTCAGTGSASRKTKKCISCRGSGVRSLYTILGGKKECPSCDGAGEVVEGGVCSSCGGSGLTKETIKRDINLSPFSTSVFRISGAGNCCRGGEPGDLLVEVHTEPDPVYEIHGTNAKRNLEISPAQAVLGDNVIVNVFGREETITIPPGTQDGTIIKKEKAGIFYGSRKGILRVIIKIAIPKIINEKTKKLYKQILKAEKEEKWPTTWKL